MPAFLGAMWLGGDPGVPAVAHREARPRRATTRNLVDLMESDRAAGDPLLPRAARRAGAHAAGDADARRCSCTARPARAGRSTKARGAARRRGPRLPSGTRRAAPAARRARRLSHRAGARGDGRRRRVLRDDERDSFLTWLPLYHDWGLVARRAARDRARDELHAALADALDRASRWSRVEGRCTSTGRPSTTTRTSPTTTWRRAIRPSEMEGIDLSLGAAGLQRRRAVLTTTSHQACSWTAYVQWGLPPGLSGHRLRDGRR